MFRKLTLAVFALSVIGGQVAHATPPCRDAKGKFTKCEAPKAPTKCRDAKGKFTKCVAPAATPASPS